MKQLICLGVALLGLSLAAAEAKIEFRFNEGEGAAVGSNLENLKGNIGFPENTAWGAGRQNDDKALHFNAVPHNSRKGGHIFIRSLGDFDFTKPFTVSFWFKVDRKQPRKSRGELFNAAGGGRLPGLQITFYYNSIYVWSTDGKNRLDIHTVPAHNPVERDVWNHLAFTCDGQKAVLYLNGVAAAESPDGRPFPVLNGKKGVCIGSYNRGYAYHLVGAVSDLKLFDSVLAPADILKLAKDIQE